MLGMTLAYQLAQQGQKVTLIESEETVGGLASTWQLGDITWDKHYHVTLLSDIEYLSLLDELGLKEEMQWVETKTGFYTDEKLYSMSNSVEFLSFPPLNLVDKLRLGVTIFYASRIKDWKKLESILVTDWLRRLSGKRTFEKIWLPLLRSKLGNSYQNVSAAFIWTTIARMYAARRSGLKKEMFGYNPGGYGRILDTFKARLESLGVEIRTSTRITSSLHLQDGVKLFTNKRLIGEYDRVVFTVPGQVIANTCPQLRPAELSKLENLKYQGIICASVLLKQPLAKYYVTNITCDWVPFTGVIEMTCLVNPGIFNGLSLVYLPKYIHQDSAEFSLSDEEIKEQFIKALLRMYPHLSSTDIVEFKVSRVKRVFALPVLNYSQAIPSIKTSLQNIFIVNSSQIINGTLNVNETVKLANSAARYLLAQEQSQSNKEYDSECLGANV